jgi:hypothetical protein
MAVERLDLPQSVGDEALAGFHDNESRAMDLQTAMNGVNHQEGGRHDLEARGMTTSLTGVEAQEEFRRFNQAQADLQNGVQENLYAPSVEQYASQGDDGSHWRKLYGDSENAKGDLRRQLQAKDELIANMQSQLASPVQPPQFFGSPQAAAPQSFVPAQPQYQVPQGQWGGAPSWNASPGPQGVDNGLAFIQNMDDEGIVYGKDVKGVIRDTVTPLISGVYAMAQAAEARAQSAQAALFNSEKARMGITAQVEQSMLVKYPWLSNISDPGGYLSTMAGLVAQERSLAPQATAQAQGFVPNGGNPAMRTAIRRATFTEGGNNLSRGEPGQRGPASSWEQRWSETLRMPYGSPARSAAQRVLLSERQGPQVTGYRDPNILTR